jgi:hypothetical protein
MMPRYPLVCEEGWERELLTRWLEDRAARLLCDKLVDNARRFIEKCSPGFARSRYAKAHRVFLARVGPALGAAAAIISAPVTDEEWNNG